MIKNIIQKSLLAALEKAQAAGAVPHFLASEPIVEVPIRPEHGDYATNFPLRAADLAKMPPLQLAQALVDSWPETAAVDSINVAHPGFINFRLSDQWLGRQVEGILAQGEKYGRLDLGRGQRVQVEYGSANPTGPLHIGFGRNVVLGDSLANILAFASHQVQREYYINDAGSQTGFFAESLYARYAQVLGKDEPVPEKGYHGQYMVEWGEKLAKEAGDKYLKMPRDKALVEIGEIGLNWVLEDVRTDLERMHIGYDSWFSERSLYRDKVFEKAMDLLRRDGYLVEREGATWFAATKLGADKDEVVIRQTGQPGYFASEIAYVYSKFIDRKFDRGIYVLGADHHWHAARVRVMMKALGLDPDRLKALIYQLVTVKRGGEPIRISKRTGQIITLREVLDEVGPDAVRYFLLAHSATSQMDFDLELAKQQSEENPVYYIQYVHARIASIFRYAGDMGFLDGDVSLLTHPAELALLRKMVRFPEIVELAAISLEPHHLAYYALDLAAAFHSFYRQCRVVSSLPEDISLNKARLKLVFAAKIVVASVLGLMGLTAPEQM